MKESHTYAKASNDFTLRIFHLAEDDIQANGFLTKLGKALQPKCKYLRQRQSLCRPCELSGYDSSQETDPGPETFSQVLDRAYMLYCQSVSY